MKSKSKKNTIINRIFDFLIIVVIGVCIYNIINSLFHIAEWKMDGDDIKAQTPITTKIRKSNILLIIEFFLLLLFI